MNQNRKEFLGVLGIFVGVSCFIGLIAIIGTLHNGGRFKDCKMILKEESGFTESCGKACVRKTHVYKYICPDAVKYEIR